MKLATLVERRFEVLLGACFLGVAFVGLTWCVMLLLKALNPVTFHFNLLMDILPWFTPVLLLLVLLGPLYWKLAGLLAPPDGGLERLADARYQLVVSSFFYLLAYSLAIWLAMNLLRIWDVYDFHFNPLVDWLPAIVPPWLAWAVGAPLLWKTLGALDPRTPVQRWRPPDRSLAAVLVVLSGALLTGGGLLLNQGVYAVSQGLVPAVAHNLLGLGIVVFCGGSLGWAALLLLLWRGWHRGDQLLQRSNPADRFRAARGRILTHGFVLVCVAFGFVALLMAAFQAMDPADFHFYLALDMWSVGVPMFAAWLLLLGVSWVVPARLARRDPAHYGQGLGVALGPTGPTAEPSWGYSEAGLTGSRPKA
ncbi:MAG: hypothetical protein ACREOA_06165 [Candidatus Dormibacteria bacterium]